jgi:outer membrane receptor protein involved in Fe transport
MKPIGCKYMCNFLVAQVLFSIFFGLLKSQSNRLRQRHSGWNIRAGVNNLTDKRYFTLRTDEYPGPGIIPAIGRSAYVSFGASF